MSYLNLVSFIGIFGLCVVAWCFSEDRRVIPWKTITWGIGLQLVLAFLVFQFPPTRTGLEIFSGLLDSIFLAADAGARFVFGKNIVPIPGQDSPVNLGYIFAFRALPTVIFFSGLMALLYNIGVIQAITQVFAKLFYRTMALSGAESLSGAANIFVGIEAAIVVKPYLAKMTRSELCAILSCCFGTAASSTLAIYVSFLKPVFPNILGHLVSASIIAIPACFVLSKILVPETGVPLTMGGIPTEESAKALEDAEKRNRGENTPDKSNDIEKAPQETVGGEPMERMSPLDAAIVGALDGVKMTEESAKALKDADKQDRRSESENEDDLEKPPQETVGGEPIERMSPLDAAIVGALDGVKMAVAIAAVLIIILGFVSLINQLFSALAGIPGPIGSIFQVVTLANIQGFFFYPLTLLTGVSIDESWTASVIIGRRLLETAIPPYQALAEAAKEGLVSPRTVLIVSYALSGFAHLASVGIFVGGTIALAPSRRKDISSLGWKALFVGTLATMMIAALAGAFYTGNASILGTTEPAATPMTAPAPSPSAKASPTGSPPPSPTPKATGAAVPTVKPSAATASPSASPKPEASVKPTPASAPTSPKPAASAKPTASP